MIVTVFRSRLQEANRAEYLETATRMADLASTMPGYVSHKSFVADDGERVTIVEFESMEAQRAWATHVDHVRAKQRGREAYYSAYRLQVCEVLRDVSHASLSDR